MHPATLAASSTSSPSLEVAGRLLRCEATGMMNTGGCTAALADARATAALLVILYSDSGFDAADVSTHCGRCRQGNGSGFRTSRLCRGAVARRRIRPGNWHRARAACSSLPVDASRRGRGRSSRRSERRSRPRRSRSTLCGPVDAVFEQAVGPRSATMQGASRGGVQVRGSRALGPGSRPRGVLARAVRCAQRRRHGAASGRAYGEPERVRVDLERLAFERCRRVL